MLLLFPCVSGPISSNVTFLGSVDRARVHVSNRFSFNLNITLKTAVFWVVAPSCLKRALPLGLMPSFSRLKNKPHKKPRETGQLSTERNVAMSLNYTALQA
jgi:hypothetical protein